MFKVISQFKTISRPQALARTTGGELTGVHGRSHIDRNISSSCRLNTLSTD